jgi:hypothetical protein
MRSSVRVRAQVSGTAPLTPKIAARFVDLSRKRERLEETHYAACLATGAGSVGIATRSAKSVL